MSSTLTVAKTVKNAVLLKDPQGYEYIKLERVRVSYPHFGTAGENENDDTGEKTKSWGGKVLLPKGTHTEAKDLVKGVITRLMAENKIKIPPDRWFMKNGDGDGRPDDEKGMWVIAFSDKKKRPTVRRANGERIEIDGPEVIAEIDEMFYGGCWISILIRPWYFNGTAKNSKKTLPKRICCGFQSVQFIKDDTPFGNARPDDEDQWKNEEGEDDGMSGGDGLDDDDDDEL